MFVACAVEAVEALTIVMAVGIVRGWRSTLIGVAAASLVLLAVVAVLGPALRVIPISALRVVVGVLLLTFGLQWLRKAVLRGRATSRCTTSSSRSHTSATCVFRRRHDVV